MGDDASISKFRRKCDRWRKASFDSGPPDVRKFSLQRAADRRQDRRPGSTVRAGASGHQHQGDATEKNVAASLDYAEKLLHATDLPR